MRKKTDMAPTPQSLDIRETWFFKKTCLYKFNNIMASKLKKTYKLVASGKDRGKD